MSNIIYQLNEIKKRFSDEVFLSNKGLSNEVGIRFLLRTKGRNACAELFC